METMEPINDITTLRNVLFETISALKDKDQPIDIDRAKAINETAQVIINTAKAEIEYLKITGETTSTGFLTRNDKEISNNAVKIEEKKQGGYTHKMGQRHN